MEWNDIKLVLAVGRCGSLSGAARSLRINYSTVFRRINALEERLNVRFFDRLATGYVLTQAGEAVMRAAERMDEQATVLSRNLVGKDSSLSGSIRVTAPEGLAVRMLMPELARFGQTHPEIVQDLVVTSGALSLSQREADVAVRATRKPPDSYLGHKICRFRFCMYASRAYAESHRELPLEAHAWVTTDDGIDFFPASVWRKKAYPRPNVVFSSNNALAALEATKRGLGVCPMPCFLGDAEPDLVRVIDPPEALTLDLWILIHADLRQTARVKALVEVLKRGLSAHRDLLEGSVSTPRTSDSGRRDSADQ